MLVFRLARGEPKRRCLPWAARRWTSLLVNWRSRLYLSGERKTYLPSGEAPRLENVDDWLETSAFGASRQTRSRILILGLFLALACAIPLIADAYIGTFSRYTADDYSFAANVKDRGFLGAQWHWFTTWTGRFSSTFLACAFSAIGHWTTAILPSVLIALWLAGMVWVGHELGLLLLLPQPALFSVSSACLILYVTCNSYSPDIRQSLYWQIAELTYLFPVVLLVFWAALILRKIRRGSPRRLASALVGVALLTTFVAGGCSETQAAMQVVAIALVLVVLPVARPAHLDRRDYAILIAGVLGSLAALALLAYAPGATFRMAFFPSPPGLAAVVRESLADAINFVGRFLQQAPLVVSSAIVFPALHGMCLSGQLSSTASRMAATRGAIWIPLAALPVAALVIVAGALAPALWAMSLMPPPRALFAPKFILVLLVVSWSWLVGLQFGRTARTRPKVLGSLFVAAGVLLVAGSLRLTPDWVAHILSRDGVLEPGTLANLLQWRIAAAILGSLGFLAGATLVARSRRHKQMERSLPAKAAIVFGAGLLIALLFLGPVASAVRTLSLAPAARRYASAWDHNDSAIRAARLKGVLSLTVPSTNPPPWLDGILADPTADPANWVNVSVASYYGLASIAIEALPNQDRSDGSANGN